MKISRQTIYEWESGKSVPSGKNLEKLSEALNVPVSAFYQENITEELKEEEKRETAVLAEFDKERELYERIIKGLEDRVAFLEAQLGRANHGQ